MTIEVCNCNVYRYPSKNRGGRSYLRLAPANAAGSDAPRLVESREYLGDAAVGHE